MAEIFRGYVKTKNKKCVQPFAGGEPLLSYDDGLKLSEFAGVLGGNVTVIDIDEPGQAKALYRLVCDKNLSCRVYRTTRGMHFVFNNGPYITQCLTGKVNALGLKFDCKYGTNAYIVLKFGGEVREILRDFDGSRPIDAVPKCLMEVKRAEPLFGMVEHEGRNSMLFKHLIPLKQAGFGVGESRDIAHIINDYVFGEPLPDDDMDKILRDKAFSGIKGDFDAFPAETAWGEVTPIDTITPPKFPLECYPATLRDYGLALANYTQTDPAMPGVILLGLLGTLFQNKIAVVSVNGNIEQTSIYSAAVAPPAERKSKVIRWISKPLNEFEIQYNQDHQEDISTSRAQKKLLQKFLTAAEKGDKPDMLFKAQAEYDCYQETQPLTLIADDTTTEALISLMKNNDERMLICSDEGGLFSHLKGRYKQNGDDTELYLKAHSGGRVSIHRKSRETEVLNNPAISLCLAVQPYVVENMLLDEENNGRGLTARFVYAYCEEKAGTRQAVSGAMPQSVDDNYAYAVKKCLTKTIETSEFLENDYTTLQYVRLSDEAREYAVSYFDITERRIAEGLERAKGWNGKCFGLAMRIAGLFHAFECMEQDKDPVEIPIPLSVMKNVTQITDCLAVHAEKVFAGNDRQRCNALYLLNRIKSLTMDEFGKQDLWQKAKRRFQGADDFDDALNVLETNGYIRVEIHQTKGRPTSVIKVNPSVLCT